MGSKPNTSSYITHLNELYSNYERVKAQLENERQTRLDEPNKNKEKKLVTIYDNTGKTLERAIFSSSRPINTNEREEISVLGHKGIWLNKDEVLNWKGPLPISQYKLSQDIPEIVKKTAQPIEYVQDISVRYLKPPPPPQHGDLIIRKENLHKNIVPPPQILRELPPPRPITPEPIVIRERPPPLPSVLPSQVITVPSDDPPPERKVIIEKMPQLPAKPAPIIIEKWLPYDKQKRNVVNSAPIQAKPEKEKNIIIEWEIPKPVIKRQVKYLGIQEADPNYYFHKFGNTLKEPEEIAVNFNNYDYLQTNKETKLQFELNSLKSEIERLKKLDIYAPSNLKINTSDYDFIGDVDALKEMKKINSFL